MGSLDPRRLLATAVPWSRVLLAVALLTLQPAVTEAQDSEPLIEIRRVATLGGQNPEPINVSVATKVDDRVFVVPRETPDQIVAFVLPSGTKILDRRLSGQGPGELRMVMALAPSTSGDFLVADPGNGNVVTYDRDLDFVRSSRLPNGLRVQQFGMAELEPGVLLLNAFEVPRPGAPLLHLVAGSEVLGSWEPMVAEPPKPAPRFRAVAVATDGRFWSSPGDRVDLTLWAGPDSAVLTHSLTSKWLASNRDWSAPHVEVESGRRGSPPDPVLLGVREVGGILWLLVRVTSPDWRDAEHPADQFEAVFLAVDAETGRILAERSMPFFSAWLLDDGYAIRQRLDANGIPVADVIEVTLTGTTD